jgi:L-alanine-DL-glutamate epimerase-like enolase superfamily enzyme
MSVATSSREITDNVNTFSRPSDLKITDVRMATIVKAPFRCPLVRIDTNQGIYGLGECRDNCSEMMCLVLKSRLLGENPCNVDKIFRKIKPFGGHARLAGGVCGIEMALMDLAGKAFGVPCYQLLGGKFRDRIRCYSDAPEAADATDMGKKLKAYIARGFTLVKMDVGIKLCGCKEGTVCCSPDMLKSSHVMHPFTGIRLTDKGIDHLCEYVSTVREIIGYEIPLAIDHFGHIGVESCIRLAQALDKFNLAWLEDMIPWQFTDQYVRLKNSCQTPICTGEDIYLKEGFLPLLQNKAVSIIHPDLATSGGIMETKKIGDLAQEHGIAMAMHMAGSPVAAMASVHCAAATENFYVLENHSVEVPWWNQMVSGLQNPIIGTDGHIKVPDAPGLGIDLVEDVVRAHLDPTLPGYFEPTPQWNEPRCNDRLWS